jgi:uncharacterized membrane protein
MYPNNRPRWFLVPIIVAVGIVAIIVGFGLYFASTGVHPEYYWFPFPLFPLALIPVFVLIFFGFRFFWGGCWGLGRSTYGRYYDPAIETLRERFAKGEITRQELDQMTQDLQN